MTEFTDSICNRTIRIAVLMTCHNRRENTITSLTSVFACRSDSDFLLKVYLVDDGSRDGTSESVKNMFPDVKLISGDGSLFWNRGMYLAFAHAIPDGPDCYLWLNDDTRIYSDCVSRMVSVLREFMGNNGRTCIVVGSTCDDSGKIAYGGKRKVKGIHALKYKTVVPGGAAQLCDTFNGNCVLIPNDVAEKLGNLEYAFKHSMGDIDYGLRARAIGVPCYVMPGFAGECANEHIVKGSYLDNSLPFSSRWRLVLSNKELPPRAWALFCSRHAGIWWPLYFVWPYVKVIVSSVFISFFSRKSI